MKRWFAGLSATFVMALSGLVPEPTRAQNADVRVRFICYNGKPATLALVPDGRKLEIFVWDWNLSSYFVAKKQCEIVSKNFDVAYEEGSLGYFVTTNLNGYPAICASKVEQGVCDRLLLTLNKGEDPSEVITNLKNTFSGLTSGAQMKINLALRKDYFLR